jgi:hypothetical protein
MRTTLTLEPDIEMLVKQRVEQTGLTMKEVINQGLRQGLTSQPLSPKLDAPKPLPAEPFRVKPVALTLPPDVDPTKLNQYLDDLEIDYYLAKQRKFDADPGS